MIVAKKDYTYALNRLEFLYAHYLTLESEEKAELTSLTEDVKLYEENELYGKN